MPETQPIHAYEIVALGPDKTPFVGDYARRQKSMRCVDGKRRRDCVVVVDTQFRMGEEKRCGKPMVGVVAWPGRTAKDGGNWGSRMCAEHFALFTHNEV